MQNQQQLNNAKWVQDKEAKKCKACKNSFNTLFRRKHHCRNCGEVFCDSCSNFFLDRKHFKESERIKKNKVRLCEACYKKIIDNLRLNGEQNSQYKLEDQQSQIRRHSKSFNVNDKQSDSVSQASTHISSVLDTKSNSLKNDSSTIIPQYQIIIQEDELTKQQKKLEQNMNDIIFQYLSLGIRKLGISENWTSTMSQFLKQMMIDLRDLNVNPERIRCVETIMQQISIKIIPFISYHATRYIRGVIIRKNVAHRKMQTIFKNAKILLLWDSLDPNINNFETLVKNEKKFIQQALEQIEKLAPNVILIEKSINNVILNELQKRNITVSIQCKVEHLNKIAETTQAKIIKSYDIFKQNCDSDCLGKCDKIVYASFDGESIRQNAQVFESLNESNKKSLESYLQNQKKDSTFLFISEPNSNRYTLSISGPKIDELKNIKECFKQQIPLAYEVLLEYQMIYQDLKLKRDLAQLYKQTDIGVQMLTCGEISDFGTFQQNNDLQNSEGILLQKVIYHKGVRSKIYDVHKKKNSECLEQYIQNNQQHFNGKKISFYCQMCDKTEEKKCFLDSTENKKNDTSLGKYIADKANYDEQKCSKCGTRRIEHISIRYGPGAFFKCVVEKKKTDQLQLNNPTDNLPSRSQTDFNSIEQQDESQIQQEIQNIEQTQNQKVFQYNITNYLKCKLCNKQLTKSYQLGQHLEYSFFRMVQHSIKNSIKYKRKLNTNWLQFYGELENLDSLNQCCHQEIERIYECGDNLVKIYTNVFETFNLKTFQFNTDEVKHHVQNFDKDEVAKRCDEILLILQKIQQFLPSLNDIQIAKSQKSSMTSSTSLTTQNQSSYSFQDIKQLNQQNEEIQKIYERMKSYQYDQFIQFEQDSMQLFTICYKIYSQILEKYPDKNKSIIMFRSTQLRQQTVNLDKDFTQKPSFFQRKTIKENTQIPISQSQTITNEYPTAQLSPQQFPYSPESPVQDMDDSGEITIGKMSFENEPNFAFLRNMISSWPRLALNLDLQSVQQQFFNYLPIYSQGEVDLIASAFNDSKYYIMHQQFQMENLWNKFQDYSNQKQNENSDFQIEATQILKEGPKQSKDVKEIIIKIQKNQQFYQKQSSNNLQEDDTSVVDDDQQSMIGYSQNIQTSESPRKPTNKVQIQIFYPKQFECLRIMNGIHITQFIKSILSCTNWNSAGGKSGSSFYKSADNLFIFKAIKQQEFETFEIFAPKYFIHMYRVFFQKAQCKSVLNKIYGMFTIKNNKGVQYFVAMENLFFGMAPDLLVYDLKGSEANRWNRKNQKTLLDTNYIIDRNGEPLPISEKDYDYIESALDFDSQFLLDVKVVDYSLLLIIDKMNHIIKLSIIDYLQDFDIKKKVENKLKLAINLGTDPTIVNPAEYYERFIKAMQRYFMKIYQSL